MRRVIPGFLLIIALASCSAGQDVSKGEDAITEFHKKLNSGDFETIYSSAGDEMKTATTKDDFVKLLSAIHRKLGDFQSGKSSGWNQMVTTAGHAITLRYSSNYQQGAADENFFFRIREGKAVLDGYHINSTALILN